MLNQFLTKQSKYQNQGLICPLFLNKRKRYVSKIAYFRYCIKLKLCISIPDFEDFNCFLVNRFSITIFCCIIVRQSTSTQGEYLYGLICGYNPDGHTDIMVQIYSCTVLRKHSIFSKSLCKALYRSEFLS